MGRVLVLRPDNRPDRLGVDWSITIPNIRRVKAAIAPPVGLKEVAEWLGRKWICVEMVEAYLQGAKGRFEVPVSPAKARGQKKEAYYRIPHPGLLWEERDSIDSAPLPADSDLSARIEYQGHRQNGTESLSTNKAKA